MGNGVSRPWSTSWPASARSSPRSWPSTARPTHDAAAALGSRDAGRRAHRRRGLPWSQRGHSRGREVVGVLEGWRGLVEGLFTPLGPREVSGLLPRGGTIIGTTRTNPFRLDDGVEHVLEHFRSKGLDALVAIGGEDTLGVAARLYAEHDFPVVGVPKTIDNDLSATDYTFGFDTAVFIATEAIDRLHTTAESHNRVMVVEVMGRHTGW